LAIGIAVPYVFLSSVMLVHLTQSVEFFRNVFAPYYSRAIWLSCEENFAKIFTAIYPQRVFVYKAVWKIMIFNLYLALSCSGRWIGIGVQSIEWCHWVAAA